MGQEDLLEEEVETTPVFLPEKFHVQRSLGRLQSMWSQGVRLDWACLHISLCDTLFFPHCCLHVCFQSSFLVNFWRLRNQIIWFSCNGKCGLWVIWINAGIWRHPCEMFRVLFWCLYSLGLKCSCCWYMTHFKTHDTHPPSLHFHCSSTKCKVWWILLNIKSTEWFSAFHYIFSFPLWFITGYWIWFFILYTKTLLFIHPIYNSLHLLIPNSQTIPSPARLLPWQSQPLK